MKTNIQKTFFQPFSAWGDQAAVITKDGTVSYQELERYSGKIVQIVCQHFPATHIFGLYNARTGVRMGRNKALVPAAMVIFRLGTTYLPVDPVLPGSRKRYMTGNTGMALLLTDSPDEVSGIPEVCQLHLNLSTPSSPSIDEYVEVFPDNCAYIIYTLGTTGNPKRIQIGYSNPGTFTKNPMSTELYRLANPLNRYLTFASISFDASMLESMMCVPIGGTLALAGGEEHRDISLLDVLTRREQVNVALFALSLLGMFANLDFLFMKTLLFDAETVSEGLFNRLKQQSYRLVDVYGLIESTVFSTMRIVNDEASYDNIGYPPEGTTYHILFEDLRQVAGGATEELYLSGPRVSPGYIGNKELNERSFISYHGGRLYRAGDLVR